MSCYQHGYSWPSLTTPPYSPLLPVGLQGYILYRHRAAVCRFELVVLPLLFHVIGVHKSTSLMSSSLLLQHCLVRLILIVFVMDGRWLYSCCFVGWCLEDLFNIARRFIIIIIMSCRRHEYPWSSLATSPYHSSPLAGPQGYISYPHRAAVYKFELVVLLLPGHMWGSIGVHHLWACPCFSSSVLHVWFIWLG